MEPQLSSEKASTEVTMLSTKQACSSTADHLCDIESLLTSIEDHLFGSRPEKELLESVEGVAAGQLQQMSDLARSNVERLAGVNDRLRRISGSLGVS